MPQQCPQNEAAYVLKIGAGGEVECEWQNGQGGDGVDDVAHMVGSRVSATTVEWHESIRTCESIGKRLFVRYIERNAYAVFVFVVWGYVLPASTAVAQMYILHGTAMFTNGRVSNGTACKKMWLNVTSCI